MITTLSPPFAYLSGDIPSPGKKNVIANSYKFEDFEIKLIWGLAKSISPPKTSPSALANFNVGE